MSDSVNILKRYSALDSSPRFSPYSKVVVHVSDDTTYVAGDDSGRVLEVDNPLVSSQQTVRDMLAKLGGYRYQPYEADGALVNPAAEVGDAITASDIYGGIYKRKKTFGRLMKQDVSAPHDEEINNEYEFESPVERKFTHAIESVRASLILRQDEILAEVVKQEDGDTQSFGWSMKSDHHAWYANGAEVMRISATGLSVKGEIESDTGKIGGFTIKETALYNGISSLSASGSGVYLGTDGIKVGSNFKVTSGGTVAANNMTLTGTLKIGGTSIDAAALRSGAQSAYNNSSTWSGTSTTVSSNKDGWTGAKTKWANAENASVGVNYMRIRTIVTDNTMTYIGSPIRKLQMTINGVTYYYLAWAYPA